MSSPFDLEAARRLPLADAALRLLDYLTTDDFLAGVFDRHRGRSYQDTITFPLFVRLIADALLGHRGSAHPSFRHAQSDRSLGTTVQAVYRKLARVPLELSLGFFAEAATRLRDVGSAAVVHPLPASVAAFCVLGFDGKKIKYVAHRLKPLRGLRGDFYGGKLLIAQDLSTRQAVAAQAVADGEAADNPLVPAVVGRIRATRPSCPRLWLGDRAFCDFKLLGLLSAGADEFLVRFNTSCGFHPDPGVPERTGRDDEHRPYREQWGWLGRPNNPHRTRARKITVEWAKDDPLALVTSLEDAERYPATEMLTLYRSRWGIEVMFQRVVQIFDLRHLIGGTPQATVFQAMLCLLLYNITMTIRDAVAAGADRQPRDVSLELLFGDLVRDLTAWVRVIDPDATVGLLRATPVHRPDELREYLRETLGSVWTDRWEKSPTRRRPPQSPSHAYVCGGHTSVDKVLRGRHKEIPMTADLKTQRETRTKPPPFETPKHG
jgi:hypothetical protein